MVGEPRAMQAAKDLEHNPPRAPDSVQVRDIQEVREAEHARFEQRLEQASTTDRPPETLELPAPVGEKLSEVWEKSTRLELRPPFKIREYGATLVERSNGAFGLVNEVRGDANSVKFKPVVGEGESLKGSAHTHPYESGLENMTFSGTGIASFLSITESRVTIVQSGSAVFALTKAPDAPGLTSSEQRAAVDIEVKDSFHKYIRHRYEDKMGQAITFKDYSEAAMAANIDACEKYGMHLYVGSSGRPLQRIYP